MSELVEVRRCSRCTKPFRHERYKSCEPCRERDRGRKKYPIVKAWRQRNKDKVSQYNRARWGKYGAQRSYPFTAEELRQRLSVYDRCWICGDPRWTEADHVKPLAKGGPHMLANLRPACSTCNRRKGATWPFISRKELIHGYSR